MSPHSWNCEDFLLLNNIFAQKEVMLKEKKDDRQYPQHKNEVAMRFHERPDFGTFTSASQVQLDVRYEELTDVINVFGLLEPYKALLFANSYLSDYPEFLCVRNMLWEHSMQG